MAYILRAYSKKDKYSNGGYYKNKPKAIVRSARKNGYKVRYTKVSNASWKKRGFNRAFSQKSDKSFWKF